MDKLQGWEKPWMAVKWLLWGSAKGKKETFPLSLWLQGGQSKCNCPDGKEKEAQVWREG